MSLAPGTTLSHYRLLEVIGRGGMGVVYKALDTALDRPVALKVLPAEAVANPERLERFQREARAVAALNHPGIVTIFSVEEAEGVHFLTMELVSGRTLQELIPERGLPLERIFQIAIPLAEALSAAHDRGIVHRDLKPSNILVTEEGRLKVLDFGLAKLLAPKDRESADSIPPTRTLATGEGKVLGTVPYMSPEQVAGKPLDHRSDIFSMGVILYEMASGRRPFSGGSSAEMASSILRDQPASVTDLREDLPGHVGWVIRRCLEKDPRRRYQSALDISNELSDLRSGLSGESQGIRLGSRSPADAGRQDHPSGALRPSGAAGRPGPAPGKAPVPMRYLILAGCLALAGMITAGWFFSGRTRTADRAPTPPPPAAAPPSGVTSIAILPFVNMSPDPDNEYFSDGMTAELISALAKVQGLKVPARTTVFALKGKEMSVEEIGRKLGVDNVLEGSVRKAGDRLRINVQLVGTADGSALWSEEYDREMKDVFAIQDEISRRIVESLKVKLSPTERHALERIPARNTRAYEFYLRGRRFFYQGGARNYRAAREMFLRAIELDPAYPLAYAGLADVASFEYMYSESTPEVLARADTASQKALELAPDLAESHASRGLALSLGKEYAAAAREFEMAIRLDPRLFEAYYFYARNCFAQGLREQAAHLFEQAMEVRPEDYQAPAILFGIYLALGRREEAAALNDKIIQQVEAQLEAYPEDTRALYMGAGALVAAGQEAKGLEWARRAVAMDPTDTGTLYNVACLYSRLNRTDEAMGYLEQAVENGFAQRAWIENDDDLNPLRALPRYKALLQRIR